MRTSALIGSAFEGRCALRLGTTDTSICGTWQISTLIDLTDSALAGGRATFTGWVWGSFVRGSAGFACDVAENESTFEVPPQRLFYQAGGDSRQWRPFSSDISAFLGRTVKLTFFFSTDNVCHSRGSFQLDDLRLYVK